MTAKAETTTAKTEYVIEPGKQELTITRVFDAPRELVFKAFTDPKLVSQWLGARAGAVLLPTLSFEPVGQTTRLVEQLVFQSVADRDGMVASGMQKGSDDSMDRMGEIPENLKA